MLSRADEERERSYQRNGVSHVTLAAANFAYFRSPCAAFTAPSVTAESVSLMKVEISRK